MPALPPVPAPTRPLPDAQRRDLLLRAGRYAAAVATLSACGGGGGDAGSPGTPPAPPPPAGGPPVLTPFANGLTQPWGLGFLPDGSLLVTQKGGLLRRFSSTGVALGNVSGVPPVVAAGQGGLLDIVIDPGFASNRTLYLSYAKAVPGGQVLAVSRCVLSADLSSMSPDEIYAMPDVINGEIHFGGRLVWQSVAGGGGNLFVTLGDRGQPLSDLAPLSANGTHRGKVLRIRASDGGIPAGNPFTGSVNGAIWSLGHRNVQGAALQPGTGHLWTCEHGPQGGDELNLTRPGANHGWPARSYGCVYGDPPGEACRIGGGTHAPTYTEPVTWWGPYSIAPAGMCFYTGSRFPEWQGNLFIASLAAPLEGGQALWRLQVSGDGLLAPPRQAFGRDTDGYGSPEYGTFNARLRDVKQGPDGWLYVLDESNGRILRIER